MNRLLVLLVLLAPRAAYASEGEIPAAALIGFLAAGVMICAGLVVWNRALGVLISAQFGAGLAVYLAHQHRQALAGADSICNINGVINCDVVNASRYAEIAGVPIAVIGFAFYVAIAYLGFRWFRGEPKAATAIAALSVLAVGYDLFLAWASYSLGSICLFCAGTWAVNVVLLIGSASEAKKHLSLGDALAEIGPAAGFGLVGLIVGVLAYQAGGGSSAPSSATVAKADISALYEQTRGPILLDGTEPVKGDPNAAYTLVEWADYECPYCGVSFPELEALLVENKDLKLLYKHYPISEACNRFVEGLRHKNACHAAAAAECARVQGRFWELSGQMFKNQEYLGKDDLRFMAEQTGLAMDAFETCMQDPATAASVVADVEAGGTAQISGTPSLFLKGPFGDQWVRVVGGPDAVAAILAAARSGTALPAPPAPRPEQ